MLKNGFSILQRSKEPMKICIEPSMHNVKILLDSHGNENPLVPVGSTLFI